MSENKEPLNKNNKVPNLRFPEFNDNWIICNFAEHFSNFSTNSLSWDQLNYDSGKVRNLHYGIIHSSSKNIISSDTLPFINNGFIPKKYTKIKNGDLILADTSEDRIDAAKGIELNFNDNFPLISGLHTIHLRENEKTTIDGYKAYYVASKSFRHFARKYCEGIKVFSIKPSLLKFTIFAYPHSTEEQEKIVKLLRDVEAKKEFVERKIEILKKYKEGFCNISFKETKNDGIMLSKLVTNKPSQLLTQHIVKNAGDYPVYDASGEIYKTIDFYNNSQDSVSIIKYGSGCGRTFIAKGKHSILGTMTELIPVDNIDCHFIYAFTSSSSFRRIVKKYKEIGTTPNLYYSDYSQAIISNKAISNKEAISSIIKGIENKESRLSFQLEKLKQLKKTLLSSLFI